MWSKTEFCEIYLLKQNFYLKKLQTAAVAAQEGERAGRWRVRVKESGRGGGVWGERRGSHIFFNRFAVATAAATGSLLFLL